LGEIKLRPLILAATLVAVAFPAIAGDVSIQELLGPAPDGDPAIVAQKSIRDNFDEKDCPLVIKAMRYGDGSISALCNNKETYRVFGTHFAMRCSAASAIGVRGC
jgi:hypothetical protein